MLPTLIEIIDTSVANVALDHIRGSLSSGIDESAWVLTSYLVSNAVIIPMTGWLARTFGRKRYLTFSVLLFTFASLLCGSSTSLGMLVFFRVLQGIGGGALQPMSQAILLETFPPKEHGMAMAIFGDRRHVRPHRRPPDGRVHHGHPLVALDLLRQHPDRAARRLHGLDVHPRPAVPHGTAGARKWTPGGSPSSPSGWERSRSWWTRGSGRTGSTPTSSSSCRPSPSLALLLFVIVELFVAEHPVVDLRAFRNISFTTGNVVMFVAFFNLLGSIVLLPLYAQLLLGYTATLAGLVLSPGGVATLVAMPLVGRFIGRHDPKYPLFLGVAVCALSTWTMSNFSLTADFNALLWPRIYLGIGMGLLFIPLTTLTLSSIPKPQMGNATSIYNLLRNLGGSIGVAFSATMFARRAQVHQSRMVEHLTTLDEGLRAAVAKGQALLPSRGVPEAMAGNTALGRIYGELVRQATMMGFNDAFYILSVMMACVLPLLFLLRRPAHQTAPVSGH